MNKVITPDNSPNIILAQKVAIILTLILIAALIALIIAATLLSTINYIQKIYWKNIEQKHKYRNFTRIPTYANANVNTPIRHRRKRNLSELTLPSAPTELELQPFTTTTFRIENE